MFTSIVGGEALEITVMEACERECSAASNTDRSVTDAGTPAYLICKRIADLVFALALFVVCFLPMVLIGILVKLDSKGPAIFSQERLGHHGKPFTIYKFRSMVVNAEANGPKWADANDNRCTKVGRFLRLTRLDELPQLVNIIRGDMSFVGPRPERAYFYDKFETYIPGFRNRMVVQPGLTGWAQVNGGYDLQPEEKLVYDLEYIENRSFKMDIRCILNTVRLVFTHKGAR